MSILNNVKKDLLLDLVQEENFVGWIYNIGYTSAQLMTNDCWKDKVGGIPHNSFLVATSITKNTYSSLNDREKEVILLRVVNSCKLPQDDDMIKTKIDNFQNQENVEPIKDGGLDVLTKNRIQFGGLECRVLGTFYMKDNELKMGSDIESFSVSLRLGVYIPKGEALATIVNYVDSIRKQKQKEEFEQLGIKKDVKPFPIGTIRYTSTDRIHRSKDSDKVKFFIQPADFLARRTAVLGMTRTGKSNMIKQTVSVVSDISKKCNIKIGQLIYDINGEYANANKQDKGSIADIFSDSCVRYRMLETEGFQPMLNNFYEQVQDGFLAIVDYLRSKGNLSSDITKFMNISLDEPPATQFGDVVVWKQKMALYKTLLYKANFRIQNTYKVKFEVNKEVLSVVGIETFKPKEGVSLKECLEWFISLNGFRENEHVQKWLKPEFLTILNMICTRNDGGTFIRGYIDLLEMNSYHTDQRNGDVYDEIYKHLLDGKIVILDLSVGNALLREKVSKNIAGYVFDSNMKTFTEGNPCPNIVFYIEEAHNLIGENMKLTDTWPRLAKEGAKYKIAILYATQEVSTVNKNILANTENWFVSHLNSEREIKELARFYDFDDFSDSLLRSQDVGFTRVKTLSSPFVVPVQVDKFDPEALSKEIKND